MRADDRTYCNDHLGIVDAIWGSGMLAGFYANRQLYIMEHDKNWISTYDPGAQEFANARVLVFGGWASAEKGPGGHVVKVVRGKTKWSRLHQRFMPIVANIGKKNWYGKHAGYAFFKEHPPKWYAYLPRIQNA